MMRLARIGSRTISRPVAIAVIGFVVVGGAIIIYLDRTREVESVGISVAGTIANEQSNGPTMTPVVRLDPLSMLAQPGLESRTSDVNSGSINRGLAATRNYWREVALARSAEQLSLIPVVDVDPDLLELGQSIGDHLRRVDRLTKSVAELALYCKQVGATRGQLIQRVLDPTFSPADPAQSKAYVDATEALDRKSQAKIAAMLASINRQLDEADSEFEAIQSKSERVRTMLANRYQVEFLARPYDVLKIWAESRTGIRAICQEQ